MNAIALALIKKNEQCRLKAYWDAEGERWTCGWGDTGPDVTRDTEWTQEEADARLLVRFNEFETSVMKLTARYRLSEMQTAALISFEYNTGAGALYRSDILKFITSRNYLSAAKAFINYDHAGGKEMLGLLKRRLEEAALFCEGSS
jgi:lysozyme